MRQDSRFSPLAGIKSVESAIALSDDEALVSFSPLAGIKSVESSVSRQPHAAPRHSCFSPLAGIKSVESCPQPR